MKIFLNSVKWQDRSGDDKKMLADKKFHFQNQLSSRSGLIIDKTQSGGSGKSNHGYTAKNFFLNSDLSAGITVPNRDLINHCFTILQILSSGYNM